MSYSIEKAIAEYKNRCKDSFDTDYIKAFICNFKSNIDINTLTKDEFKCIKGFCPNLLIESESNLLEELYSIWYCDPKSQSKFSCPFLSNFEYFLEEPASFNRFLWGMKEFGIFSMKELLQALTSEDLLHSQKVYNFCIEVGLTFESLVCNSALFRTKVSSGLLKSDLRRLYMIQYADTHDKVDESFECISDLELLRVTFVYMGTKSNHKVNRDAVAYFCNVGVLNTWGNSSQDERLAVKSFFSNGSIVKTAVDIEAGTDFVRAALSGFVLAVKRCPARHLLG